MSAPPSDDRFLVGGIGGKIKIYNAETGDELVSLDIGIQGEAGWSPDGTMIAISDWDGNLWILPAWQSTEELIDYANECCIFRELTPDEREQFGLPSKP